MRHPCWMSLPEDDKQQESKPKETKKRNEEQQKNKPKETKKQENKQQKVEDVKISEITSNGNEKANTRIQTSVDIISAQRKRQSALRTKSGKRACKLSPDISEMQRIQLLLKKHF